MNLAPIIGGLTASVTLLVLAIALIGSPVLFREADREEHVSSLAMESVGLLQLLWLFGKSNDVQERVAEVEIPSMQNLRGAGMISVRLDMLRQRAIPKVEDESEQEVLL